MAIINFDRRRHVITLNEPELLRERVYRAMKKINGQEDFFLGGRSFGKFLQTFSMFGQATSAESAVSMSSTVGQKGLAGVFFSCFSCLCMAVFVMLYAAGGGLEAAVWTDAIQSIFILVLTALLIPFAMVALNTMSGNAGILGPFEAVHRMLPGSMLELLGSPKLAGFTWYYMLLLALVGTAGGFAYSNNLVVCAAAKNEDAARYGAMNGIVLKRASTVFWAVLALFILALYGTSVKDPDLLWGMASKDLLPVGLLGLMLACLLAALMSTTDTHMVVISGLITNNIYKPLVGKKSEKHYLNAGRIFGLVHITGGILVALFGKSNLFEMLIFMMMINVTMGPSVLMAFLWRRTNTSGVWCSMGVSLLLTLFIPLVMSWSPGMRENTDLHLQITPPPIVRSYTAREWDVRARSKQIEEWTALNAVGKATGECPTVLSVGERFEQSYAPPAKAVFWAKGIKLDDDGKVYGDGFFRAELFLMHTLGLDMSSRSVAAIESISIAFKLIFPFAALILFGLFGKQNDNQVRDGFYTRLLTPVHEDPEQDAKAVAAAAANPRALDERKLWPRSNWYIRKWDWQDWKGIIYAVVAMVSIGGLMWIFATLGS